MNQGEKAIHIMLVDDHRTMLWGLEKLIESANPRMQVIATATNCTEALASIATTVPDLVLLDVDLDGESGLDILPALTANSKSRVLILTGSRDQALLDSAILQGARGILRKDAPASQLLKAIDRVHQGELWFDHETLGRVLGALTLPVKLSAAAPEPQERDVLTARELKIVKTIVAENGATNKYMAEKLFISEHTLRNHLSSIYQKLGVRNRLELYVYAIRQGLAHLPDAPPSRNARGSAQPARPKAEPAIRYN